MQNRYVGDVADFGKHGLLRFLSGMTSEDDLNQLRLGLVWYMFPDERHGADRRIVNADGKHVAYLKPIGKDDRSNYRNCDPGLWEKLKDLVCRDVRCVHCAEGAEILPDDTAFYDVPLHFPPYMLRPTRKEMRKLWLCCALQKTDGKHIVCLDPDNGIADAKKMYRKNGPKFTYLSDLREFWERGQSLVVYHHLPMDKAANDAIREKANLLETELGQEPIALRYFRGSARVFFVIPRPCHKEIIEERVARFLKHGWEANGHFKRMGVSNA